MRKEIIKGLFDIGAIKIDTEKHFTWSSGIESPMYMNIRLSLSHDNIRRMICNSYVNAILNNMNHVQCIAGVATGAISQGTLVADRLGLPFVYVRDKNKGHGLENILEGQLPSYQNPKVVIVEDVISTGESAIRAANTLKKMGADVIGVISTFCYGFDSVLSRFTSNATLLFTLTDFKYFSFLSCQEGYVTKSECEYLLNWFKKTNNSM